MRIVSWNVNSLKPRHDRFWFRPVATRCGLPSRTKSLVEDLPKEAIESAGGIWPRLVKRRTTAWPWSARPNRSGLGRTRQL